MTIAGMAVFPVSQGSTASLFRYVVLDEDNNPDDIRGGTAVKFHAKTPDDVSVSLDAVAAYETNGSDGVLVYELTSAAVDIARDLWCEFEVQGLSSGTLVTDMFIMRINPRAKVT